MRYRVESTRVLSEVMNEGFWIACRISEMSGTLVNPDPENRPLYLNFFNHHEWIKRTDDILAALKTKIRKKDWNQFAGDLRAVGETAAGKLFELNVFGLLSRSFRKMEIHPKLPGCAKRADFLIEDAGKRYYVEAAVLHEGKFWNTVQFETKRRGRSTGAFSPQKEASRIVHAVTEKFAQTATDAPNVMCLSFFSALPTKVGRQLAFTYLFSSNSPDGFEKIDSVFEFGRNSLVRVWVNKHAGDRFRLTDATRHRLSDALKATPLMIE